MKSPFLLSLLLSAACACAFADTISISPAAQDVSVGQTFAVFIDIDNIPDLFDYQFSLSFNPAVLAAQSVTEGALFSNTGNSFFQASAIDNSSGSIALTADTLLGPGPGVAGPGTIAVVDFTALASGTSSIDFSPLSDLILQDSFGDVLAVTPQSGDVTVGSPVATAPEPATLSLLASALALMTFGAWRRSRRSRNAMTCATLAGLCVLSARADTITTFDATGTFHDGATLSGTLTIDTTTGNVVSSTVEALPDASGLTDIFVGRTGGVTGITLEAPAGSPELILDLPVSTLVGYTGGPLASLSDPSMVKGITVETTLLLPTSNVVLSSGSLTPATAAPEPAAFGMICAGGLAFIGVWLRRKRYKIIRGAVLS